MTFDDDVTVERDLWRKSSGEEWRKKMLSRCVVSLGPHLSSYKGDGFLIQNKEKCARERQRDMQIDRWIIGRLDI